MLRDYDTLARTVRELSRGVSDRERLMEIVADAVWDAMHAQGVSWAGFYTEVPGAPEDERLVLGPRRDTPACSPIGLFGVCGAAYTSGTVQTVTDVADLGPNYIACDPRDRSEIVLPLVDDAGRVWGVFDVDSHDLASFGASDDAGFRAVLGAAGFTVPGAAPAG